jgi:hypothetical protein
LKNLGDLHNLLGFEVKRSSKWWNIVGTRKIYLCSGQEGMDVKVQAHKYTHGNQ